MKIDISKYLDIPFIDHGRDWNGLDCYGLLRLFYKTEMNIILPDYVYECDVFNSKDFDIIEKKYRECFKRIEMPIPYCGVGFRKMGSPFMDHMGIMLDDTAFLHAYNGGKSCVDKLSHPYWRKVFYGFYEIKDNFKWQD